MEKNQYIVAIEIGSSKIVGAIAQKELPEGTVKVKTIQEVKISECVRYGCIKNVEEVKRGINEVIGKLSNCLKDTATISSIYLNLAGRSIRNESVQVSELLDKDTAITQDLIERLIKKGMKTDKKGFDTFDAVPLKYVIDNVEEKKPVGVFGSNITVSINNIIGKSTIKTNLNRAIIPTVRVNDVILTPLAIAKHVLSAEERELGCMLVDMGAETTTVIICKNSTVIHLATLPFGGRNITRDIMSLNLLEEKAEELKLSIGNAMPNDVANTSIQVDGIPVRDVVKYVESRSEEIAANINEQLNIAGIKGDDLGKGMTLIGGASLLPGMMELLEKTTGMKVKRGTFPQQFLNGNQKGTNSPLYIQMLSIIAEAAERMHPDVSCLERIVNPEEQEEQEQEEQDTNVKNTKSSEKKSILSSMLNGFRTLFTEKEEEEEEDDSYGN